MTKLLDSVDEIVKNLGGKDNISLFFNCMTRLRVVLKDRNLLDEDSLKKMEGINGIAQVDEQTQLIVGPGLSAKLCEAMQKKIGHIEQSLDVATNKNQAKARYANPLGSSLKVIGSIFIPLLPAFIACGLLLGLANFLKNPAVSGNFSTTYPNLVAFISLLGGSVFFYMNAIVGYNASKEFGGTPILGVAFAAVIYSPALNDMTIFGMDLSAGKGGIIAILLVSYFGSKIEKFIRKYMPNTLDLFFTPFFTLLITGFFTILCIQPVAGILTDGITNSIYFLLDKGGIAVGFLLAASFLPMVMLGIHHGLSPIMLEMLQTTGLNPLLTILAMAGAGQVGSSLAVLYKTKNIQLKKTIKSAIPAGLLGVGEPLIYGVTLPLGTPFLGACIGGAFGGAIISLFNVSSVLPAALSGLILSFAIAENKAMFYLLGVITAYSAGFIATSIIGFKDPPN